MNLEEHNPEDRQQIDSLAGRLAELRPSSATSLQAHTFYRAGMQSAKSERKPVHASRKLTFAAVALLFVSSSYASYLAGLAQSEKDDVAATVPETKNDQDEQISVSIAAEVDGSRTEVAHESAAETTDSLLTSSMANWFPLPRFTPEDFMKRVEARTAPGRVNNVANDTRQGKEQIEKLLREFQGPPSESPLRRWLSM